MLTTEPANISSCTQPNVTEPLPRRIKLNQEQSFTIKRGCHHLAAKEVKSSNKAYQYRYALLSHFAGNKVIAMGLYIYISIYDACRSFQRMISLDHLIGLNFSVLYSHSNRASYHVVK